MKNKFLCIICAIIILSTSLLSLSACDSKSNTILGKWEITFPGIDESATMEFGDDGTLKFILGVDTYEMTYEIDYSYTPDHIDLTFEDETLETIIEFPDKNTFKMQWNLGTELQPRPTAFSDAETITGERK